jgi:hypothetical protein
MLYNGKIFIGTRGGSMVCYSFNVRDFQPVLLADLPAHCSYMFSVIFYLET